MLCLLVVVVAVLCCCMLLDDVHQCLRFVGVCCFVARRVPFGVCCSLTLVICCSLPCVVCGSLFVGGCLSLIVVRCCPLFVVVACLLFVACFLLVVLRCVCWVPCSYSVFVCCLCCRSLFIVVRWSVLVARWLLFGACRFYRCLWLLRVIDCGLSCLFAVCLFLVCLFFFVNVVSGCVVRCSLLVVVRYFLSCSVVVVGCRLLFVVVSCCLTFGVCCSLLCVMCCWLVFVVVSCSLLLFVG